MAFTTWLPVLILGATLGVPSEPTVEAHRLMSFNIRYLNRRDGWNQWDHRKHVVAGVIRFHGAGIVGLQEAMAAQVGYLHGELPKFDSFGSGRDGAGGGERCTIFFDRTRYEKRRGATFWLSPTPDQPSRAWGASLRRICTWGEFASRASGRVFYVFNTHFDHQSERAREKSAALLVKKIAEIAGDHPVILLGDFNCAEDSAPYATLTCGGVGEAADSERALFDAGLWTRHAYGPPGTWTGWDASHVGGKIDFIFAKNGVEVLQHGVVPHDWQGRVASDHRPVLVEVRWNAAEKFEPETLQLNHGWRLAPDPKRVGEKKGVHEFDYDDSEWPRIRAGEPWERQGHPELDGTAYLRKRCVIPASWRGRTVKFVTSGVADAYTLYVNGVKCHTAGGVSESVWTRRIVVHLAPSTLRFGEQNSLVLRVNDTGGGGGLTGYPVLLTIDERQPNASAEQFQERPIVERTEFGIPRESRRVEFEVAIPADTVNPAWLRVGIGHGYDDSGDRGVHYELHDRDGNVVHRGFTASKDVVWFEHLAPAGSRWKVIVVDSDTSFGGRFAGNGCSFEARLKSIRPTQR